MRSAYLTDVETPFQGEQYTQVAALWELDSHSRRGRLALFGRRVSVVMAIARGFVARWTQLSRKQAV